MCQDRELGLLLSLQETLSKAKPSPKLQAQAKKTTCLTYSNALV